MVSRKDANKARLKRHKRVRAKISGTAARPRLAVYRSNANISAQIIDDVAGVTLVSASTYDKAFEGNGGNKEAARAVGKAIAEKIYERHTKLTGYLELIGVDKEIASKDACKIEHVISDESFEAIKRQVEILTAK